MTFQIFLSILDYSQDVPETLVFEPSQAAPRDSRYTQRNRRSSDVACHRLTAVVGCQLGPASRSHRPAAGTFTTNMKETLPCAEVAEPGQKRLT